MSVVVKGAILASWDQGSKKLSRSQGIVGPPVSWNSRSAHLPEFLVSMPSGFFRGGRALVVARPLVYVALVRKSLVLIWANQFSHCDTLESFHACWYFYWAAWYNVLSGGRPECRACCQCLVVRPFSGLNVPVHHQQQLFVGMQMVGA